MSPVAVIDTILTVYTWVTAAVVIMSLFFIARFYELKSGERSHFRLFAIPALLFIVGGLRCAFGPAGCVGDYLAEGTFFVGGTTTILLGSFLVGLMAGNRR